jgi:hypothetical protein
MNNNGPGKLGTKADRAHGEEKETGQVVNKYTPICNRSGG